jgi:hypothetical protein
MSESSLERARADIELICAAYPEEVRIMTCPLHETDTDIQDEIPVDFPFLFTLTMTKGGDLRKTAHVTMELPPGYPQESLRVSSYRGGSAVPKRFLEQVPCIIRTLAETHAQKNEECGLEICAQVLETWRLCWEKEEEEEEVPQRNLVPLKEDSTFQTSIPWISGQSTITDRKSVFQAHLCIVHSEVEVQVALRQLIDCNTKIQKATHNMVSLLMESLDEKTFSYRIKLDIVSPYIVCISLF